VGIHAFNARNEDVDTRDKPAQDDFTLSSPEYRHGMLKTEILSQSQNELF